MKNRAETDLISGFRDIESVSIWMVCTLRKSAYLHDASVLQNRRVHEFTIFLDFRKAFDSVPHNRLLLKLERLGVSGNVLKWISSFLWNRSQRVVINGPSP